MDNPVGTLLLLWPTLTALILAAKGWPGLDLVLIFSLGTFIMRSAGCVINDFADRNLDGNVARTKDRPLVTGALNTQQALIFFAALLFLAVILVLFLNRASQYLAIAGALVACAYPFMKRWTNLPQLVLGAAFSWGILMAWTTTGQGLTNTAGVMFITSLLWIVAYDTMYAMADREDDLKAGIKSTAILFADLDRLIVGILQLLTIGGLLLVAGQEQLQHGFYLGVFGAGVFFVHQQRLIRRRIPAQCLAAFRNNVWVGFSLFCGAILEFVLGALNVF